MVIRLHSLEVSEGEATLLSIPELCFEALGLIGVMGANGAGKTTLLRCLLGLRPFKGTITIDGAPALGSELSYVPQGCDFPFDLKVEEVVMIGRFRHHGGFPGAKDRVKVAEALEAVGIQGLVGRGVHTLSGGEGQKVHIARALAADSRGLILDEPCANLDPGAAHRLLILLKSLADSGHKVILSLHDIELAAAHLSCCLALEGGRVAFCSPGGPGLAQKLRHLFSLE